MAKSYVLLINRVNRLKSVKGIRKGRADGAKEEVDGAAKTRSVLTRSSIDVDSTPGSKDSTFGQQNGFGENGFAVESNKTLGSENGASDIGTHFKGPSIADKPDPTSPKLPSLE